MKSASGIYVILLIAIAISSIINLFQWNEIEKLRSMPPSTASDEQYINYAASLWAKKTHVSVVEAMKERYARVIYFQQSVCVSIENDLGGVGGVPVYCFDVHNNSLIRRFDDVE